MLIAKGLNPECARVRHCRSDSPSLETKSCGVLREVSRQISLHEILGTPNGLQVLAKFLEKTGAFTKTGKPRDTVEPVEMRDDEDYQFRDKEAGSEGGGGEEEPEGRCVTEARGVEFRYTEWAKRELLYLYDGKEAVRGSGRTKMVRAWRGREQKRGKASSTSSVSSTVRTSAHDFHTSLVFLPPPPPPSPSSLPSALPPLLVAVAVAVAAIVAHPYLPPFSNLKVRPKTRDDTAHPKGSFLHRRQQYQRSARTRRRHPLQRNPSAYAVAALAAAVAISVRSSQSYRSIQPIVTESLPMSETGFGSVLSNPI
ncbi:hypothetical protein R3P38DRAFT_2800162 [Favolaschia claudopus]|uniref:Uncharacterized protein n=1 Tax=Favolaschia claudopus TaxID=2862362 RepID=A0AAV9ZYB4_9AGAR